MDSGRLQPALFGGLFIGVLSALPLVNMGNCCCCLWVIAGGALATYLRQQNTPYAVQAAEGALLGLMAGALGGLIAAVLSIPMMAITGPMQQQMMERVLSGNQDVPPEVREMLQRAATGTGFRAVAALFNVVIFSVFGLLGGLLGVVMFKKNAPPPPAPGTMEVLPPE